mgnify:CR=1 FL=1
MIADSWGRKRSFLAWLRLDHCLAIDALRLGLCACAVNGHAAQRDSGEKFRSGFGYPEYGPPGRFRAGYRGFWVGIFQGPWVNVAEDARVGRHHGAGGDDGIAEPTRPSAGSAIAGLRAQGGHSPPLASRPALWCRRLAMA